MTWRQVVPLSAAIAVAGCVPPAPLAIAGQIPTGVSRYTLIAEETIDSDARSALAKALASRGFRAAGTSRPDVVIGVELSDRPLASGTVAGTDVPLRRDDPAWTDRPQRSGMLSRGRRAVRLAVRFLKPDGRPLGMLVASETVTRNAAPASMAALIERALTERPAADRR